MARHRNTAWSLPGDDLPENQNIDVLQAMLAVMMDIRDNAVEIEAQRRVDHKAVVELLDDIRKCVKPDFSGGRA